MRNLLVKQTTATRQYNDIIRYRHIIGVTNTGTTSVLPAQTFFLFQKGQGQIEANLSTQAAWTMLECDTSLYNTQGIIPNASEFTCYGIAIDVHAASIQATTAFADNTVTAGGGTINVNPLAVANPYPAIDNIRMNCSFELWLNSFLMIEQGNVSDYPSGIVPTTQGSNGQASVPAVTSGPVQAAYTQNGFIYAGNGQAFRPLTVAQTFEPNDQFLGKFIVCRPMTFTGTGLVFYLDFLLIGEAKMDYTGKQTLSDSIFPFGGIGAN